MVRFALLVLALVVTGCAGLLRGYDLAPSGLTRHDDALRADLAQGRYERALSRVSAGHRAAPSDKLLRLLYEGVVAHYAGRYAESSAALDRAALEADDRRTRRLSREALSLITSDLALPYTTPSTERLLIHYYAALNYLNRGDPAGAAVEARRLSMLLQQMDAGEPGRYVQRDAVLRYFAGTVFEAAGERNDADVAYRNAARLARGVPEPVLLARPATPQAPAGSEGAATSGTDSVALALDPHETGEVIVVVERGYVAHRVEQSITIALLPDEVAVFSNGGPGQRSATALEVAARVLADPGHRRGGLVGTRAHAGTSEGMPYLLRIAWPTLRHDTRLGPARAEVLTAKGDVAASVSFFADLSGAVAADFEREQTEILARAVLRAAAKHLAAHAVEKSATDRFAGRDADEDNEEEDAAAQEERRRRAEVIGGILGAIVNIGGAVLEQADTRSWHLLPADIGIARIRVPAGRHEIGIRVPVGVGPSTRSTELGTIDIRPGEIRFLTARIW